MPMERLRRILVMLRFHRDRQGQVDTGCRQWRFQHRVVQIAKLHNRDKKTSSEHS
jgi:hypothetical protein